MKNVMKTGKFVSGLGGLCGDPSLLIHKNEQGHTVFYAAVAHPETGNPVLVYFYTRPPK